MHDDQALDAAAGAGQAVGVRAADYSVHRTCLTSARTMPTSGRLFQVQEWLDAIRAVEQSG